MAQDQEDCLRAGCDAYTTKPLDGRQLADLVARYTLDASPQQFGNQGDRSADDGDPTHSPPPDEVMRNSADSQGPATSRILLVDDSGDVCKIQKVLLESRGYEVHTAHDGRSALAAFRQCRPQIVLLDIGLPDMSGYEVVQQMRNDPESGQVTRFIALSGYGEEEHRARSQQAGFHHHVLKPADLEELIALFGQHALEQPATGR